jgi:radical SAM superfamily enzyme YgiQ (UPF0313 family)
MDSEFKRAMSPSLALLILGALTPCEHEVTVEDENVGKLNLSDRPDLVGISVNVDTSCRSYAIARHYRRQGVKVVLGGIHVSANPDEALFYADSVCIGEAEDVWFQILEDAQAGNLKKKYYNSHPTDLSHTPIPKWSLIDKSKYIYTNVVVTGRGCPFHCEFCYNSCAYVHHWFRNRPIKNVIEEIRALDTRQVMFIDDNFIGNVGWTKEFLRQIKPLDLTWHAAVSANIVHYPLLLDEMKESGCKSLFIGFETINKASLLSVDKRQNNTAVYEKLIRALHERGIMVNASLVFGFDHDGPAVFDETLNWLVENKIETMTAHILTPYPGTKIYQKFLAEGRIVDLEPTHYNTSWPVFSPKKMTRQQLYRGYLKIYRNFYSLKNIIKRLPKDPAQRIPYLLFNFIYRKFGKIVSRIAGPRFMNRFGKTVRRLSYGIE